MANIDQYLEEIEVASRGEEVRDSIIDAFEALNSEGPGTMIWDNITDTPDTLTGYGVSEVPASMVSGVLALNNIPPSALERVVPVADDTARFALTSSDVQNGDTVKVLSTLKLYLVVDDTSLSTEAGYEEYRAGTADSVDWSGVLNTPDTLAGYGIEDAYTKTQTDTALAAKSDKSTTYTKTEVDGLFDEKGLVDEEFGSDQAPYLFRKSGGDLAEIGESEYDKIIGGSVAWNQLVPKTMTGRTYNGVTFTNNGDGIWTANGTATGGDAYCDVTDLLSLTVDHKIFIDGCPSGGSSSTYFLFDGYQSQLLETGNGLIVNKTNANFVLRLYVKNGTTVNNIKFVPQTFDLTAIFGSTIADYIYNLEQSTAGAGVAFFRKLFPKDYYPYDAGSIQSVSGLKSHDTVGFNQWDEEWEHKKGYSTGVMLDSSSNIASKNYIPVIPNTDIYIQFPSGVTPYMYGYDENKNYIGTLYNTSGNIYQTGNAKFIKFATRTDNYSGDYNHDICINISDAEKNGTYEPYQKRSYPLDSSLTLRGIPKLDANNKPYYDGDTYEADGTVTRRYGIVDLGTLTWAYDTSDHYFYARVMGMRFSASLSTIITAICSKYPNNGGKYNVLSDKEMTTNMQSFSSLAHVLVKNSAYSDAESFKTAVSGAYLVYELATPTAESAQPFQSPQKVDALGTEEYVTTSIVPVGHETRYVTERADKMKYLPEKAPVDGDYFVHQEYGDMSLVSSGALLAPILGDLASAETSPASASHAVGEYLLYNNRLYKVLAAISAGQQLTIGTNIGQTNVAAELASSVTNLTLDSSLTVVDGGLGAYVEKQSSFCHMLLMARLTDTDSPLPDNTVVTILPSQLRPKTHSIFFVYNWSTGDIVAKGYIHTNGNAYISGGAISATNSILLFEGSYMV